jgi:hypothetical protein
MKKLLIPIMALLLSFGAARAQNTQTTQTAGAKTTTTAPTKKDGTPDKRYKENKNAGSETKHVKKDGTPDKRYKENKTDAPAK